MALAMVVLPEAVPPATPMINGFLFIAGYYHKLSTESKKSLFCSF